eukprot:256329_1
MAQTTDKTSTQSSPFIFAGHSQFGKSILFPPNCSFGAYCKFDSQCIFGNNSQFGAYCKIRNAFLETIHNLEQNVFLEKKMNSSLALSMRIVNSKKIQNSKGIVNLVQNVFLHHNVNLKITVLVRRQRNKYFAR